MALKQHLNPNQESIQNMSRWQHSIRKSEIKSRLRPAAHELLAVFCSPPRDLLVSKTERGFTHPPQPMRAENSSWHAEISLAHSSEKGVRTRTPFQGCCLLSLGSPQKSALRQCSRPFSSAASSSCEIIHLRAFSKTLWCKWVLKIDAHFSSFVAWVQQPGELR